jgi:hypothetical protein
MSLRAAKAATPGLLETEELAEKVDHKEQRTTHVPKERNTTDQTVPQANRWMKSIQIGRRISKAKTAQMENRTPMNSQEYPTRRLMVA